MDSNCKSLEIKEEIVDVPETDNAAQTSKDFYEDPSTSDSSTPNCSTLIPYDNDSVKFKLKHGIYKISSKRKRSRVWEVFARILNENDEEIDDYVICQKCQNIYKFFQKSTSNLSRHRCYAKLNWGDTAYVEKVDINADTKMEGTQIFSQWIIENGRSLKILEDSGLKKLTQFLISVGAEYGKNVNIEKLIPKTNSICKNIEDLCLTYFDCIKTEIKAIKAFGFALTCNMFDDSYLKVSYVSLTIHYIQKGNLISRLLGLKSFKGNTGENIVIKTREILKCFECSLDENVIVVTEGSPEMITAFRANKHIICLSTLINNVVQKSIDDDENVKKLYHSCDKLVKYLNNSNINAILSSALRNLIPTRWNKQYYLFATIKKTWPDIVQYLQERNNFSIISDISISNITAVSKLLQFFEEASKKLEEGNNATIHFAYVYVHRLEKNCSIETTDSILIKELKKKLSENLKAIVVPHLTIYHKISLFVFPPTKKLILFNENEKAAIKQECKRIMSRYITQNEEESLQEISLPLPSAEVSKETLELFSDFVQQNEIPKIDDRIEKEMLHYETTSTYFHDDFNVLEWWESHRKEFPLLYKLSCMIFATPASNAASEKVFSLARNLMSEKNNQLNFDKDITNKIIFLNLNMDKFD